MHKKWGRHLLAHEEDKFERIDASDDQFIFKLVFVLIFARGLGGVSVLFPNQTQVGLASNSYVIYLQIVKNLVDILAHRIFLA